ncbi:hypothetical protein TYRP_008076 [Tyrophagus putrescentiae]|nr:hypothetical protein TYRP_008076 [Tyrophagus putrescentiae]
MVSPLFPSLTPRYVDDCWFSFDTPFDEDLALSTLEKEYQNLIQEIENRDQPVDVALNNSDNDEDEDEDEDNEDDDDEDQSEDDDDEDDNEEDDEFEEDEVVPFNNNNFNNNTDY